MSRFNGLAKGRVPAGNREWHTLLYPRVRQRQCVRLENFTTSA
ncbi:MAG TPA: hypothetical protein VGN07_06835 [Steroidobacteraceae bacterium]